MTTERELPVSETRRLGPTLVADTPVEPLPPVANIALLGELKERIRAVLMTRIDPSVAGRIPRARLRGEVAQLVSEIATEDRAQLNKLEETTLAADLSDDMIGLGPLEPF